MKKIRNCLVWLIVFALKLNPLSFFGNSGIFMTGNARAFGDAEHLCNIL